MLSTIAKALQRYNNLIYKLNNLLIFYKSLKKIAKPYFEFSYYKINDVIFY